MFLPFVMTMLLAAVARADDTEDTIKLLCAGKHLDLTAKQQILELAHQFDQQPDFKCADRIRSAVSELSAILREPSERLCTVEVAQQIRDFYLKYLDTEKDRLAHEKEPKVQQLPKSLSMFAIAHGMQVANICDKLLIEAVISNPGTRIAEADLQRIDRKLKSFAESGLLSETLQDLDEPAELAIPADFARLFKASVPLEKIHLQTRDAATFAKAKAMCESRLEPIYKTLILPSAILGSVGYLYRDNGFEERVTDASYGERVKVWLKVTHFCEGLKFVEAIDSPPKAGTDQDAKKVYRVVTKAEFEELKQKLNSTETQVETFEPAPELKLAGPEFPLSDEVLNLNDAKLMNAVNRVRIRKMALGRVRGEIMRQTLEKIIDKLENGRAQVVLSPNMKSIWRILTGGKADSGGKAILQELQSMRDDANVLEKKTSYLCWFINDEFC